MQAFFRARSKRFWTKSFVVLAAISLATVQAPRSFADKSDSAVDAKVSALLSKMSQDEKITILSGTSDEMHVPGLKRLGIPELKFSDGPMGVRCYGKSTAYPAGAMLAASWDADAAQQEGKALGRDCRARGVHVLLAPGCDLYRVPQCGRNFEYFGEDPFLSARMTVGYIKGVQGENVATSVKHYAANDQEILRDSVDTIVDERRLQEICFPPFKAAVQEANVWTVMAAYNKVNGDWCTANSYLLTDVLRKQWGFKGILMSDWGAVHDCLGPITAGTDLEMGKTVYYTADNIKRLMQEGKVTQQQIDEHVARILRMSVAMGFFDNNQEDKSIPLNDLSSAKAALNVAREGLVLLKNDNQTLPLDREKLHSVVVMGPNACPPVIGGGGSSEMDPFYSISLLDAVTSAAKDKVKISYIPNWVGPNPTAQSSFNILAVFEPQGEDGQRGMKGEYFDNPNLSGNPVATKIDGRVSFNWGAWHPVEQIKSSTYSVRWTGKIKAAQTDNYTFAFSSDGARIKLDGKTLFDNWDSAAMSNAVKTVRMQAGETHDISIEYHHLNGGSNMLFNWGRAHEALTAEEAKVISDADAVIAAVGFNWSMESEGFDRPYDLPIEQVAMLNAVSKLNPRTIVVLNAGGNVGMD